MQPSSAVSDPETTPTLTTSEVPHLRFGAGRAVLLFWIALAVLAVLQPAAADIFDPPRSMTELRWWLLPYETAPTRRVQSSGIRFESAFLLRNARHAWAVGVGGIARSVDGGRHWSIGEFVVEPDPAIDGDGWLKSVQFFDATHGIGHAILSVGGSLSNVLVQSSDSGLTWRMIRPPDRGLGELRSVRVGDGTFAWAVYERGVEITESGGDSWARRTVAEMWDHESMHFFDASDGVGFFRNGSSRTLRVTTDSGRTWDDWRSQPPVVPYVSMFLDRSNWWIFADDGAMARSRDGGRTWAVSRVPPDSSYRWPGQSAVGGHPFFVNETVGWVPRGNDQLLRTEDGGRTWAAANLNATAGFARRVHFSFADRQVGLAIIENSILLTNEEDGDGDRHCGVRF